MPGALVVCSGCVNISSLPDLRTGTFKVCAKVALIGAARSIGAVNRARDLIHRDV